MPPNIEMIASAKMRYSAVRTRLLAIDSTTALPTLFLASPTSPLPSEMLTNAQQPSPIITAMASATTVSGKTTVFAALP